MSRPWLALYERLPWARRDAARPALPPALIQRLLPPEMILEVFALLPPASLGATACVCTDWRELAGEPALWRAALSAALGSQGAADAAAAKAGVPLTTRPTASTPSSSPLTWRSLFLATPALRTDGLYISRNSYLRVGLAEWRFSRNTCHVATYFRYLRFLPPRVEGEGDDKRTVARFWYRTSPDPPAKAARALALGPPPPPPHGRTSSSQHSADRVLEGRWRLGRRSVVRTALRHDNTAVTEVRSRLRLRGTTPGAWNRLDVLELTSFDLATGQGVAIDGGVGGGDDNDNRHLRYSRGLSTYVFVKWADVPGHVFNLPLSEMDVFIPG